MRIGALGGPATFAGQAAEYFSRDREPHYFPSGAEEWQALDRSEIDAFVMLAESSTTGPAELARRAAAPEFRYFVLTERQVPYGCLLLAKPNSGPIKRILGHGSVSQCKPYLDAHHPDVQIEIEQTSSLAAADKVLKGDGSLALVGTARTAELFGLEVIASDIDAGATGNYWLVGRRPDFAAKPRTLIVSGRSDPGLTIAGLADAGFSLRAMASWPTGRVLFEYDYLLSFTGQGELPAVQRALADPRLIGAF